MIFFFMGVQGTQCDGGELRCVLIAISHLMQMWLLLCAGNNGASRLEARV
jgi:hypothetical protein